MNQLSIDFTAKPRFDGKTYESDEDEVRLTGQLRKVHDLMIDGLWRDLREIADCCGCSEASASARMRDLRKVKFGALNVDRKRVVGGLFVYRVWK